jgi:hypothetical protein
MDITLLQNAVDTLKLCSEPMEQRECLDLIGRIADASRPDESLNTVCSLNLPRHVLLSYLLKHQERIMEMFGENEPVADTSDRTVDSTPPQQPQKQQQEQPGQADQSNDVSSEQSESPFFERSSNGMDDNKNAQQPKSVGVSFGTTFIDSYVNQTSQFFEVL